MEIINTGINNTIKSEIKTISNTITYKNLCEEYSDEYKAWKENQLESEKKKLKYYDEIKLSYKDKDKEDQRIESVLNAIDVLDDYSQKRSEEAQKSADIITSFISISGGLFGASIGTFLNENKKIKTVLKNLSQYLDKYVKNKNFNSEMLVQIIPAVLGAFIGGIVSQPVSTLVENNNQKIYKIESERVINNELKDPKSFAILDDNQKKIVDDIVNNKINSNEIKKEYKKSKVNILKISEMTIENLLTKEAKDSLEDISNIEQKESKINIREKDKELLSKILQKIEIDTNDYLENIELAVNKLKMGANIWSVLGAGASVFSFNIGNSKNNKIISSILFLSNIILPPMIIELVSKNILKEGEQIARFQAKQSLRKHPELLYDIDKTKYKNIEIDKFKMDPKEIESNNKGLLNFLCKYIKDKKEYKKLHAKQSIENRKIQKAKGLIDLDQKQLENAKELQKNTFDVLSLYNRNYDKYYEKVESKTTMLQSLGLTLTNLAVAALAPILLIKNGKDINNFFKDLQNKGIKNMKIGDILNTIKGLTQSILSIAIPMATWNILDTHLTKKEKETSRIATMLSLKELE